MSTDVENYIFDLSRELRIEDTQGLAGNELELIALVKNCPYLYDKSRKDFKDYEKKEATWKAIATVMHSTVDDCQMRWKALREQYGRIKRAILTHRPDASKLIQWEFIDDMKFLDPYIRHRWSYKTSYSTSRTPTKNSTLSSQNIEDENYSIEWLDDSYSEDKDLKFINLVKSHPYLYDKTHVDYKDQSKKEAVWKSIAQVMCYSVEECQRRWMGLREKYARERKLRKSDPFHRDWHLYSEISFLDKHVKERNFRFHVRPIKTENIDSGIDSSSTNVLIDADLSNDMTYQVQKLEFVEAAFDNGTDNVDTTCLSPVSVVEINQKSDSSNQKAQSTMSVDEDDLFGQSIAAELKKITSRRKKMKIKSDIFKLFYDYECDDS